MGQKVFHLLKETFGNTEARQLHYGLSHLAAVLASMISSNLLLSICIGFRKGSLTLKDFCLK